MIRSAAALRAARRILGEEAGVAQVLQAQAIIIESVTQDEIAQDEYRKLKQKELREFSAEHRKQKQQQESGNPTAL